MIMKRLYSALIAAILLGAPIYPAVAALEVSVDFFHDNLDAYGDWREVGDYGYVWQPRHVDRDWRPYSDGRWLYTDAGWTWDSDEPYSWAVYHYGRWARVDRVGWVWVPGTEWGPAWVSWRRSERHVGWAPLPPEARFSHDTGFGFGVDVDFDIGPANYRFVLARDFGEQRLRRHYIEPRENITIINQTTNITNITYVNSVVNNQGPSYDAISRQSAQPIRRLKLERREDMASAAGAGQLRTKVSGDSYQVMAPTFDAKPATAPRKLVAKVDKPEVDRGWKNAGTPAAVAKLRTKIKSEPAPTAELPPQQKPDSIAEPPTPAPDKVKDGDKPPKPVAPIKPEAAPGLPEKPVAPEKPTNPGKPEKGAKPVKPEPGDQQLSPPVKELAEPPAKPLKSKDKATPRAKADAPPKVKAPEPMPVSEDVKPPHKQPPAKVEKIQPVQPAEHPKAAPAHKPEHIAPSKPEPRPKMDRPEPRKPAAPEVAPTQPAKEKGKAKKKNGDKPEDAPQ